MHRHAWTRVQTCTGMHGHAWLWMDRDEGEVSEEQWHQYGMGMHGHAQACGHMYLAGSGDIHSGDRLSVCALYCKVPAPGGYELDICIQVARKIVENKEVGLSISSIYLCLRS